MSKCFALIVFVTLSLFSGLAFGQKAVPLLRPVEPGAARPTPLPDSPAVSRARFVTVDTSVIDARAVTSFSDLMAGGRAKELSLNLFDDVTLKARFVKASISPDGNTAIWTGKIDGTKWGEALIVATGNVVSAKFTTDTGKSYLLRYSGTGDQHIVEELVLSKFPDEGAPIPVTPTPDPTPPDNAQLDDGSTIDVLVVYTPAARVAAGGTTAIENDILLAVADTNKGYANSGIIQRVRLVYAGEVGYAESGVPATDLQRLQAAGDGYMDEVHTLRNAYGADIVSLWTNSPNTSCGIGYLMTTPSMSFADHAFNVIQRNCAVGNYSFAHEMGHNMGAAHSRETAKSPGAFPYSYAYQQKAAPPYFRSIMAEQCANGDCPRIPYWSNPNISYFGAATGVDSMAGDSADNRETLNNTRKYAANWRSRGVDAALTAGTGSANGVLNSSIAANSTSNSRNGAIAKGSQPFANKTPSAGSVCSVAAISLPQTINETLTTNDCFSPLYPGLQYYARRYTFSGISGQQIAILMQSAAVDSYLVLLAPDLSVVASNDDGGGGLNARIPATSGYFLLPFTGTYTLEASTAIQNQLGAYSLQTIVSNTCTYSISPTSLTIAAPLNTGTIDVTADLGCAWTATPNASWITLTSGVSGAGNGVVGYQASANTGVTQRTGTITVTGQSTTRTFSLTQNPPVPCLVGSIAVGQTVTGALSATSCTALFRGPNYYSARYAFSGTAGQTISIDLASTAFDTYLYLIGPDGQIVAQDDDGSGTGSNSRIPALSGLLTLLATGTYTIEATSFATQATGAFSVTLSGVACSLALSPGGVTYTNAGGSGTIATSGTCSWTASTTDTWLSVTSGTSGTGAGTIGYSVSPNPTATSRTGTITVGPQTFQVLQLGAGCTLIPITVGTTTPGTLSASSCTSAARGSTYYAGYYTFTGSAGQQVIIEQTSTALDSFVYLRGPDSRLIASDDDSGGALNARIPATSYLTLTTAGTYTIEATTHSINTTGTYAVGLRGPDTPATMITPVQGSVLSGSSVTFTWNTGSGASAYWLDVGSSLRNGNYFGGNLGTATSKTVNNLPVDGSTVYVTLYSFIGSAWVGVDYTYIAAASAPAEMTSPVPGSVLAGPSVTFSWSPGAGVTAYWLDVGSSLSMGNYFGGNVGTATSKLVSGLPSDGSAVYVSLYSQIGGVWVRRNYTYTAASDPRAVMISPVPGSALTGTTVTFTWSAGTGATAYWLDVGSSQSVGDYFGGNVGSATSKTLSNLPANSSPVYVSLYSLIGGVWQRNNYTYTAVPAAQMTSPAAGSILPGPSVNFTWTTGTGATAYWLDVGSSPNVGNYFGGNVGTATSKTVGNLPLDGSTVYVALYSQIAGAWVRNNYTYTATNPAQMISPAQASVLVGSSVTFTWSAGTGATAYWLDVGSTPLVGNYFGGNVGLVTSKTVSNLPVNGSTVYVSLYSQIGGVWVLKSYSYTAATATRAQMTSPAPSSVLPSRTVTFAWSPGNLATAYWLDVGSAPFVGDYFGGNVGTATSKTVSNLPANGSTVYVSLYSQIGGSWVSYQYTYTATSAAQMTSPTPGSTLPSATVTFSWSAGSNATAYWLDVGTSPLVGNISAGNVGTATSKLVSGIPTGTIYVSLYTLIDGAWVANNYTYTR